MWVTRIGDGDPAVHVRRFRVDVVRGPDAGLSQTFAHGLLRIGGKPSNDLCLSDRKVSGLHLEIRGDEQGYLLRDLESTNGTFVHGMRVKEVHIQPGTPISIGETELRFVPLDDSIELPLADNAAFPELVGDGPAMRKLFGMLGPVARTETTVLIEGETGTGKELVAEGVHRASSRAGGPFVVVDCGATPPTLFESELFGHERGAFTGADKAQAGLFEQAHGGTLFLDELGELPLELQPKLLRVLQSRRVRRVGGSKTIDCDVRLVAATNRDLAIEVNRGTFREDLFYRLAVAVVEVPPLRSRREDIPLLVEHFRNTLPGGAQARFPASLLAAMQEYYWPGNVRELRNAVERAIALPGLPLRTREVADEQAGAGDWDVDVTVPFKQAKQQFVDEFDRRFMSALLDAHGGNVAAAARATGIDRVSVYKIMNRLGIKRS